MSVLKFVGVIFIFLILHSGLIIAQEQTTISDMEFTRTSQGFFMDNRLLISDATIDSLGCFDQGEVSFSPTGEHFLVVFYCFEGDNSLFLFNADGSGMRQITEQWDWLNYTRYSWNPDGQSFDYERVNSCCLEVPQGAPPPGRIRYYIESNTKDWIDALGTFDDSEGDYTFYWCNQTPAILLRPGDEAVITSYDGELNMRQERNYGNNIIRVLYNDEIVTILGTPFCQANVAWFRVRTEDDTEGWAVEAVSAGRLMTRIGPVLMEVIPPTTPEPIPAIFTPLTNPDTFSDGSLTGCETFDVREADVIYINGIATSPQAHYENLLQVCEAFADKKVLGIYNLSETEDSQIDIQFDVEQAISDLGEGLLSTRTSLNLGNVNIERPNIAVEALVTYLLSIKRPLTIVAHSQGAAITSAALRRIESQYYRQRPLTDNLVVYTFGGYAISFPEGPQYRHCIRDGDLIPVIADQISRRLSPAKYADDITNYRLNTYGIDYLDEGANQLLGDARLDLYLLSLTSDIWTAEQHSFDGYMSLFGTGQCPKLPN